jgi:YbbR domain-containing protein
MLERILANWPLKLLAVTLAFAIWVAVTGENLILQDFQVPLEIQLPDNLVLASPVPTTVGVRLRGLEGLIRRIDPVPMVVRVDLDEAAPGERDLLLSREGLLGTPRGVEVVFINPDRLRVTVDRQMRRELEIQPTFLGRPAKGYVHYGTLVNPTSLPVEGPATQVQNLEVLGTNPIDLEGHSATFVARVGVVPEGLLVRVLDPRPLDVRVIVDARAVERRLADVPVRVTGPYPEAATNPAALDVTLSGPPDLVERLAPDQVRLTAEVEPTAAAGQTVQAQIRVELTGLSAAERLCITVKSLSRETVRVRLSNEVSES